MHSIGSGPSRGSTKSGSSSSMAPLPKDGQERVRYDVQIYGNLPLYVRTEVLRGRVLYCPDERFLYDVAYRTIREFDAFKHRLYDYIGKQAIV